MKRADVIVVPRVTSMLQRASSGATGDRPRGANGLIRPALGATATKIRDVRREMRDGFSTMAVGMSQITALLTIATDKSEEPDES